MRLAFKQRKCKHLCMHAPSDFRSRYQVEMERRESEFLRKAVEKNPLTYLKNLHMRASLLAISASVMALLFAFDLYLLAAHRISDIGGRARAIVLLLACALWACTFFLQRRWYRRCIHQAAARNNLQS